MTGTALVTGGARGIGQAICLNLARAGWRLATTYLPGAEDPKAIAQEFDSLEVVLLPLDLRSAASARTCVQVAAARLGGLDALINNAAVGSATVAHLAQGTDAQDSAMLAINAAGTLAMCRAFLASVPNGSAARRIVNIASVGGGIATFPGFSLADGMSKAAVAHLTRQLAAEAWDKPLDVFALCPGATDTEMFRQSTLDHLTPDQRAAFLAGLPKGRLIQPGEIAEVVAFLLTPAATILNGAVVDASMGLGVRPGLVSETRH